VTGAQARTLAQLFDVLMERAEAAGEGAAVVAEMRRRGAERGDVGAAVTALGELAAEDAQSSSVKGTA